MTNITPKTAYIPLEYTLSVEDFLEMWEDDTSGQEGEPTQEDYDKFCLSVAEDYFYDMRSDIYNICLKEHN